jgi:hypothetical protein
MKKPWKDEDDDDRMPQYCNDKLWEYAQADLRKGTVDARVSAPRTVLLLLIYIYRYVLYNMMRHRRT